MNAVLDPNKAKVLELAESIKRKTKEMLIEKQKIEQQRLEDQKKIKEAELVAKTKTTFTVSDSVGSHPSRELIVDEMGREIDVHGRVLSINRTPELLINKRAKDASTAQKEKERISSNPYYDPSGIKAGVGRRRTRAFNWVTPGTFVKQADELRSELESQQEKPGEEGNGNDLNGTGEGGELEEAELAKEERKSLFGTVPSVEWWDKPFLKIYSAKSDSGGDSNFGYAKDGEPIQVDISTIDNNVLHPVKLKPTAEKPPPPPLPLKLTKKEERRIVKRNRTLRREEEQVKIQLELKEAPPPRVRIANMYRVYGADAMQDPTAIETKVREEIALRAQRHDERNQERKKTPQQKREKRKKKLVEDTTYCTNVCAFKVLHLTNKKRFQVEVNAQQTYLTGCCIIGPGFSIVVVEGGPKGMKRYKKLMLRRIKWEVNDAPKEVPKKEPTEQAMDAEQTNTQEAVVEEPAKVPVEEDGMEITPEEEPEQKPAESGPTIPNRCDLIWEGEVLQAAFSDFQMKTFKSELQVRKFLADRGVVHYWDLAKTFIPPPD
uniref:Uncharacterized protein n=1 Tax=Arcella intermedia TaxID=1963864 RepID=A0A6B2L0M2_9EUKA